ncbi:MAG: hypothetical protein HQ542_10125 [Bacteroidia bacterium]|nr:hypothetical protein [Bacteroidia bacterium]
MKYFIVGAFSLCLLLSMDLKAQDPNDIIVDKRYYGEIIFLSSGIRDPATTVKSHIAENFPPKLYYLCIINRIKE